jgi:hypothetical protein
MINVFVEISIELNMVELNQIYFHKYVELNPTKL